MSDEISYVIGDSGQSFDYEYLDENGDAVNLAGQEVQLIFQTPAGALKTRSAVLIASNLKARYTLIASDFQDGEEGIWFREFNAQGASFDDTTQPVAFFVAARLSAP